MSGQRDANTAGGIVGAPPSEQAPTPLRRLTSHGSDKDAEASAGSASAAWADERRRLLAELARRVKEANGLRGKLATATSEVAELRSEAQRSADVHAVQAAELEAQVQQANAQVQQHEAKREEALRRCAELQRRAVGASVLTHDSVQRREEIAAVALECAEIRDRLSRVATQRRGSHTSDEDAEGRQDQRDGIREDIEEPAHYISDEAIQGTGKLFSVLVNLQERLAAPPPPLQQTAEESAVAEQIASRWELEYACGRAERQRDAMQRELESERRAVKGLKQQLTELASSGINTGSGAIADLEDKLAVALQKNTELFEEKDAAESKLRMLEHDDGGPAAGEQIHLLTRQLREARAQIVAADERAEVAAKKCIAMEHELAQEKSRYDQLRLQVDSLVAATTSATTAVASPWHSPRLVSRSRIGGQDIQRETPSRRQQPGRTADASEKFSAVLGSPASTTSYGMDDEVLDLTVPPPPPGQGSQPGELNATTAAEDTLSSSSSLRQRLFMRSSAHN